MGALVTFYTSIVAKVFADCQVTGVQMHFFTGVNGFAADLIDDGNTNLLECVCENWLFMWGRLLGIAYIWTITQETLAFMRDYLGYDQVKSDLPSFLWVDSVQCFLEVLFAVVQVQGQKWFAFAFFIGKAFQTFISNEDMIKAIFGK